MKRIISVVLSLILLLGICVMPAAAMSKSVGPQMIKLLFRHGEGPFDTSQGLNVDYSYYSPVVSSSDKTKYPLVVITPGALEGQAEGEELYENDCAMWACDELQAQFRDAGGAFIMIARAQEDISLLLLNWSSSRLVEPLFLAIEDFIDTYSENIDTNRIYGIGWCQGAKAIINMELAHPGFFTAVMPMVMNFAITEAEADALSKTNMWMVGSVSDTLGNYKQYIAPSWNAVSSLATGEYMCRLTRYTKAKSTDLAIQHNVWDDLAYDFNYEPRNEYAKTTLDFDGSNVTVKSLIHELSIVGSGDPSAPELPIRRDPDPGSAINGGESKSSSIVELLKNFLQRIVSLLQSLLQYFI